MLYSIKPLHKTPRPSTTFLSQHFSSNPSSSRQQYSSFLEFKYTPLTKYSSSSLKKISRISSKVIRSRKNSEKMEKTNMAAENDLNLKATELRLGLPGTNESENDLLNSNVRNNKRALPDSNEKSIDAKQIAPASKAQIVGWPPVRSYRKNNMQSSKMEAESSATYVKVSMDGAPFLRKIDLKVYKKGGYSELLKALENMFNLTFSEYSEREGYEGSEYAPAYEDKDGDLMLVGDVPFEMFISSCKRLRIMKGAEARGLGCNI